MAKKTNAIITTDAVTPCIDSLNNYSLQLKTFYDKTVQAFVDLGDFHQDQNYVKYEQYFNEFWPQIEIFRTEIERFNQYLIDKKEYILKEVLTISINKPK
jgi:hypothetical protein